MSRTFRNSVSSPTKISQMNELTALSARLQNNVDQLTEHVVRAEELLDEDAKKAKRGMSLTWRIETGNNLTEAEMLLKEIYMDVDKVKKLKHPQSTEIELDVSDLHNRWSGCCAMYQDLHKKSLNLDLSSHARSPQGLSMTLEESANHKSPLHDYITRCNKEIDYLTEQQNRIRKTDWSDRIRDSSGMCREYEKFKSTGLRTHESEVNKLRDEAKTLQSKQHPGSHTINKHVDDLQKEWQRFLNLLNCQESHLNNVDLYKKYQLDAEMISESLKRINSTMEPSLLANMRNSQIITQLEGEERAVQRNGRRLTELRDFCSRVAPLPLRRAQYTKCPVMALCDWSEGSGSVRKGDKCTLVSSPREENWEVKDSRGETKVIPGACFVIPPPDNDAIEQVKGLEQDFAGLKKRRASLQASVKPSTEKVEKEVSVVQTVTVSTSVPDSSQGNIVNTRLDRLISDLLQLEKNVHGRLRAPLAQADSTGDLTTRIREHERAVSTLKTLEAENESIQHEVKPLLSSASLSPANSSIPPKLSTAKNKIEDLNALTDLYSKKANAVMSLEKQIKKVNLDLMGMEKQLSKDPVILEKNGDIEEQILMIKKMNKNLVEKQDSIQKLNHDLELTEQLCGHLQKGFQEYCPDISRRENEVRTLRNRYSNINNLLQQRLVLLQEADDKLQSFQSAVSSLNKFLSNLPNNEVRSEDTTNVITNKQNSQKSIIEELKRKSEHVDQIQTLSRDLQNILKEYETISNKYCSTVGDVQTDITKQQCLTLAEAVQNREKNVVNRYKEVLGENVQLLDQMGLAKNMINKHETLIVNRVVVHSQYEMDNVENLKKELSDEVARRNHFENELKTYQTRMMSLRSRRGVERVEEKETVLYYRDPKLEADFEIMKNKIDEEVLRHAKTHAEIEIIKKKIFNLEHQVSNVTPKLIMKVSTEYERDTQLEKEEVFIREEMRRIREEIRIREMEIVQSSTEITFLENKKSTFREMVVKKEVLKLEKDPEMLRAVIKLKEEISAVNITSMSLSDGIFQIRSQINMLERIIPTVPPKIVVKEVKKVEQDDALIKESNLLRSSLEEIRVEIRTLIKEISILQEHYSRVETVKQKIEVKETVNEVYRIDPETEIELRRLRKEIQKWITQRVKVEKEISLVSIDIKTLRSEKPNVEVKEVVQEVVKQEKSPEIIRELTRLREHLTQLQTTYRSMLDKLTIIRKERDEWRVEKSKIETKIVTKEVIKYEKDPLLEKEAIRLRKEVQDENQLTLSVQENITDLRQKFFMLEKQKHEEKIVYQKVVVLQQDKNQIIEHERLVRRLDEEMRVRRAVEEEVQKLRTLILEKEKSVSQSDVRQQKTLVEVELRKIRNRILEFENAPPPVEKFIVEEIIKVERDANIEKLMNGLSLEFENEHSKTVFLQRDIQNMKLNVDVLTKEKSKEKMVYKEVIRYEKDLTVEAQRNSLREQLTQLRIAIKNQEEEMQRVHTRLTRIQTTVTTYTMEEATFTQKINLLRKEKEELLQELNRLETQRHEINITFQHESRLMSERTHTSKQRILKLMTEIESLERDILTEKERIHQKDMIIIELTKNLKKEENSEAHTTETTKSTKITILDPETGKDMSAYDAFRRGLIDRDYYIHLQTLECSWEEITSSGSQGEYSVLLDRKSGKKYSIEEALLSGRLTKSNLQQYKEGKISISEFALMVAGEDYVKTPMTSINSPFSSVKNTTTSGQNNHSSFSHSNLRQSQSLSQSTPALYNTGEETFPIAGVLDTTTKGQMSVRSAMTRKLIDPDTAMKLLEAQAATGGIVDITKKERYSVHKAAQCGLIETNHMQKLMIAQKAFTGVEDPVTKERLSVGLAAQKGLFPKENAKRYMEAQVLTGGLVDPNRAGRMLVEHAVIEKMIDQQTAKELQDDLQHQKELVDPITRSKITYKEAMAKCKKDESNGLLLLPAASSSINTLGLYSNSYSYSSFSLSR